MLLTLEIPMPAALKAERAAGTVACAMKPFFARAWLKAQICTTTPLFRLSSCARSREVMIIPLLPSAGWVCVPKLTVPPSCTGRNLDNPALVDA